MNQTVRDVENKKQCIKCCSNSVSTLVQRPKNVQHNLLTIKSSKALLANAFSPHNSRILATQFCQPSKEVDSVTKKILWHLRFTT